MDQARVVVIGGGITGCSVAYHLAEAGWSDVLLVEKAQLTAGSTCQAAGLVTVLNPSATMTRFRRYSTELYRRLGVFDMVGSLRLASSREQLQELERSASRARAIGLEVDVISADSARRLLPAMSEASLHGAVYLPEDGHLDPHQATLAMAAAARSMGVRIRTHTRVTGIALSMGREVTAVETDQGRIAAEHVVVAAGIWAPQVLAMAGAFLPSTPIDHQHIALRAVPGHELPRDMPCFRDPDNLVYGKSEHGGMVFGGYEAEPASRWVDGVPWDHAARSLAPDFDRFAPLMAGAVRRFPFLRDAEVIRLVCHPDAMTPDANPLLGPMPGIRGLWVAAGLSLNGFGGGGGIGRAMAGWITAGDPGDDVGPYRAWRFGDPFRDPTYVAALAREAYADYYRLRFPYDADQAGRPRRLSPLHGRLQESGAVFGTKAGWERSDYHLPGHPWRRAGRDQSAYGWTRPPWFDRVGDEHRAVRERAGIIDLTSFGKIDVRGAGAVGLLQRACANDIDRPVGSVVYGQFLDPRGGVLADVTVTRLGIDAFRVTTGAGYVAADLGWLRLLLRPDDPPVEIRDVSEDWACIGLWGPRARDVVLAADGQAGDGLSDTALPMRRAAHVRIAGAPVLASRLSYAGELGWELTVEPEWATQLWDALMAAGQPVGLDTIGYRALDSLRMEKGYRYYGTDLTSTDSPFEAGLGAFVRLDKEGFVGREALLRRRDIDGDQPGVRLRTIVVGDGDYLPVYGGEAVRSDGSVVGRVRSAAYGHSVSRVVASVYLPARLGAGSALEVDVFSDRVPAAVAEDVLHDPAGRRMRG